MPVSKELVGMWRYAVGTEFRKRVRRIALRILCQKIDNSFSMTHGLCGTLVLNKDCPFYCKTQDDLCFAPNVDREWTKIYTALNPRRNYNGKIIPGCYILPFCEKGYTTYQNIKAWKRRACRLE